MNNIASEKSKPIIKSSQFGKDKDRIEEVSERSIVSGATSNQQSPRENPRGSHM